MDFDFSGDQKMLQAEARRYLARHCAMGRVRAVLDASDRASDLGLWRDLVAQGWTATALPEAQGGTGFGRVELCALAEELGRAVAPVPFASTVYLLAEALMLAGSAQQQSIWLPRIAAGETIGCYAASERPGAWTSQAIATRVANGRLTGEKLPVTDGEIATVALVVARSEGEAGLFLVPLDQPGVSREVLATADPTRGAARLRFDGVVAEPLGNGLAALERVLDHAAVYLAFEQLGGAERCLEMARDYALERFAFGRPIGSYQAIKHKLADAYVKNQLARSLAYYGAWAIATGAAVLPVAAAAARIAASEAFDYAARENIQVHGGIGTTWEADCHLYYRRAKQLSLMLGAPSLWKERLIGALRGLPQQNGAEAT